MTEQRCHICQGRLESRQISHAQESGGRWVIIENLPAFICTQCGKTSFTSETSDLIAAMVQGKIAPIRTEQIVVYDANRPVDKLTRYRDIIRKLVEEYAGYKPANGDIRTLPVIDSINDHYGVLMVGWDHDDYTNTLVIHIDIIDGKVWLQYDGTDALIGEQLVEAGIPKEDIVLGFHPPEVRQHTGFAVG